VGQDLSGTELIPGALPRSGLIFDRHGSLYGTTYGDGKKTHGSVFEISPLTYTPPGGSLRESRHLTAAIPRWEVRSLGAAPLPNPQQPRLCERDDLNCFLSTNDTHLLRQKDLVHAEHKILIFLYFETALSSG